jgi:hypothetical protein
MRLLDLVSDLTHDELLLRRFCLQPFLVLDEYDIRGEARAVLHRMDKIEIQNFIKNEIDQLAFPAYPLEWPDPIDPDCGPGGGLPLAYPNPKPQVYKIDPAVHAVSPNPVPLLVKGEGFSRNATLALALQGPPAQVINAIGVKITGTYRCSHLHATVDLSAAAVGVYDVQLTINPGSANHAVVIPVRPGVTFTVT